MEPSITPKQKQIFDFIQDFERQKGYAPSQQEIAKFFGFKSLGTVQDYLNRLSRLKLISRPRYAHRAARPTTPPPPQDSVPLLGRIAAGRPIESIAASSPPWVSVPAGMTRSGGEFFSLVAQGDSMIDDGILPGDQLIVRAQTTAENGDIVVAMIDQEATLKRIYRQRGRIELHPANPKYAPICVDPSRDFRIQGVLVGVVRYVGGTHGSR